MSSNHFKRIAHKMKMSLRGRSSGQLVYAVTLIVFIIIIYYGWNFFSSSNTAPAIYPNQDGKLEKRKAAVKGKANRPLILDEPELEPVEQAEELGLERKAWESRLDREQQLQDLREQQLQDQRKQQLQDQRDKNVLKFSSPGPVDGQVTESPLFRKPSVMFKDDFQRLERLVHFDLKGAPPLVSYVLQLLPLLKNLGATGLLMEYEDMFPYSGNLSILASRNAYSVNDLEQIQHAAKSLGLEIVPLIQTFGHMEFVLKHERFEKLRESDYTPQAITPSRAESYNLLNEMISQVLKAHPDAKRIHLGCDEVYELGKGKSRSTFKKSQNISHHQLFLSHVVSLALYIRNEFSRVKPLIWDDMLRSIPEDIVKASDVPSLVEPVIWYYRSDIMNRIPMKIWHTYGRLFKNVWVASAFKGATGPAQYFTNASFHLENHQQWVEVIRELGFKMKLVNFRGIMLTGWQRYDHYAILCELLPVAIPSLAMCLQTVERGGFSKDEMIKARDLLRCSSDLELSFPEITEGVVRVTQDCRFPGSAVYYAMQQLWGKVILFQKDIYAQDVIAGWLTDSHIRRGVSNPLHMKNLERNVAERLTDLIHLRDPLKNSLLTVYDGKTVEEWLLVTIDEHIALLNATRLKAKALQNLKNSAQGFSPLPLQKAKPPGLVFEGQHNFDTELDRQNESRQGVKNTVEANKHDDQVPDSAGERWRPSQKESMQLGRDVNKMKNPSFDMAYQNAAGSDLRKVGQQELHLTTNGNTLDKGANIVVQENGGSVNLQDKLFHTQLNDNREQLLQNLASNSPPVPQQSEEDLLDQNYLDETESVGVGSEKQLYQNEQIKTGYSSTSFPQQLKPDLLNKNVKYDNLEKTKSVGGSDQGQLPQNKGIDMALDQQSKPDLLNTDFTDDNLSYQGLLNQQQPGLDIHGPPQRGHGNHFHHVISPDVAEGKMMKDRLIKADAERPQKERIDLLDNINSSNPNFLAWKAESNNGSMGILPSPRPPQLNTLPSEPINTSNLLQSHRGFHDFPQRVLSNNSTDLRFVSFTNQTGKSKDDSRMVGKDVLNKIESSNVSMDGFSNLIQNQLHAKPADKKEISAGLVNQNFPPAAGVGRVKTVERNPEGSTRHR